MPHRRRRHRRRKQTQKKNVTKGTTTASTDGPRADGLPQGQGQSSSTTAGSSRGNSGLTFVEYFCALDPFKLKVTDPKKVLTELYFCEKFVTDQLLALKLAEAIKHCEDSDSDESESDHACPQCYNNFHHSDRAVAKEDVASVPVNASVVLAKDVAHLDKNRANEKDVALIGDPGKEVNDSSLVISADPEEILTKKSQDKKYAAVVDLEDTSILKEKPENSVSVCEDANHADSLEENVESSSAVVSSDEDEILLNDSFGNLELEDEPAAAACKKENISPVLCASELLKKDAELRQMLADEEEKEKVILERCRTSKQDNNGKTDVFSPIGVCWSDYTELFEDSSLVGNTKYLGNLLARELNNGKENIATASVFSRMGENSSCDLNRAGTEDCLGLDLKNSHNSISATVDSACVKLGEDVPGTSCQKNEKKRRRIYQRFADFIARRRGN